MPRRPSARIGWILPNVSPHLAWRSPCWVDAAGCRTRNRIDGGRHRPSRARSTNARHTSPPGGSSTAGSSIAGSSIAGSSTAGSSTAGTSIAGSVTATSVTATSVTATSVTVTSVTTAPVSSSRRPSAALRRHGSPTGAPSDAPVTRASRRSWCPSNSLRCARHQLAPATRRAVGRRAVGRPPRPMGRRSRRWVARPATPGCRPVGRQPVRPLVPRHGDRHRPSNGRSTGAGSPAPGGWAAPERPDQRSAFNATRWSDPAQGPCSGPWQAAVSSKGRPRPVWRSVPSPPL